MSLQYPGYRVSAIVSTYNSEKYIRGKLRDLVEQSLFSEGELEIVVVNTGSEQGERAIVEEFCSAYPHIKYIETARRETVYQAWNRGIKEASGKYITNANTDDRLRYDALEILADELDSDPSLALVYGDVFVTLFENQTFSSHIRCGYHIRPDFSKDTMLSGCHMGPQPMWRRELHERLGYFNEDLKSASDYEFWCRIALFHPMKHVKEFLGLYHENPGGICNSDPESSAGETALIMRSYQGRLPQPVRTYINNYQYKESVSEGKYTNICMVTYNRLEFTKSAIASILQYTCSPYTLTVVDNASSDGTQAYLSELHRKGIVKNLILLPINIGVAKASNLAWQQEPKAQYYLKYDNDIVIQKPYWLSNMVKVIEDIPEFGAIGYSFEPVSYHADLVRGHKVRVKRAANIGGACYLIPKRTEALLGYWCEDYGLYGEEDGDYSLRMRRAGYVNAYMDDENIGIHLPGGRAGGIEPVTKRALSADELKSHPEYRQWKDSRRQDLQKQGGLLERNLVAYMRKARSLYVPRGVFCGKLDASTEIFERDDEFVFMKDSGKIDPLDDTRTRQAIDFWTEQRSLDRELIEKVYENERVLARVPKKDEPKASYKSYAPKGGPVEVSIIIPLFNQIDYTKKCLQKLYENTPQSSRFEVIVIDNASTDGTCAFFAQPPSHYFDLRVVRNAENLRFARACNLGAKIAKGRYLVFLNNDTEPESGWLESGIRHFRKNSEVGIVGSKLIYPDGTLQHAGIEFKRIDQPYFKFWPFHRFRLQPHQSPEANRCEEVHAVTGACLFMPRELFEKAGGFPEEYEMYFEDIDLNLRVRALGKKIIYEPQSVLVHHEGKSTSNRDEIGRLNFRAAQKFFPRWIDTIRDLVSLSESPSTCWAVTQGEPKRNAAIKWGGHVFDYHGHASHSRLCLSALYGRQIDLSIEPFGLNKQFVSQLSKPQIDKWQSLMRQSDKKDAYICFAIPVLQEGIDVFAAYRERNPGYKAYIGIATFETDRLPAGWADSCNAMDEIWVPSSFNRDTFAHAGVDPTRLHVFPTGIDSSFFDPSKVEPMNIAGRRDFSFLSVFQWTKRKGWDVLLKAYLTAFSSRDDVCLVLRTYPYRTQYPPIRERIHEYVRRQGLNPHNTPPIIVVDELVAEGDMPSLYAAADAFVLPTRGEGFGIPFMEAMAMGLPVIGTRWSGHLDFMNEANSYLIDLEGLAAVDAEQAAESSFYTSDHRLASPSVAHTAALMRRVYDNRNEGRLKGLQARQDIVNQWNQKRSGDWIINRVNDLLYSRKAEVQSGYSQRTEEKKTDSRSFSADIMRVIWEGSLFIHHSFPLVNREMCLQLLERNDCELSLIDFRPYQFSPDIDPRFSRLVSRIMAPLSSEPNVHIRHVWPPNFDPPPQGHWVMIQPWEYGRLPEEWIEPMTSFLDEIWVPSRHVMKTYLASGIPAERVKVVPNGVNTGIFNPQAAPFSLPTSKRFKFLFVGGTIWRKGIDLLLEAYRSAFSREDDVVLVIKDTGQETFYNGQGAQARIQEFASDPASPEILYLTQTLEERQMPGVYTACDCLVHPYRGEGFAIPVVEAMACGLAPIVTAGGATDDYCFSENSYLIPSRLMPFTSTNVKFAGGVGWVNEPDVEALKATLRHVYEHPQDLEEKRKRAFEHARENLTWEKAAEQAMIRIRSIAKKPVHRLRRT